MNVSTLINKLSGKWYEVIKAPTPPSKEVAQQVLGGVRCKEVMKNNIIPILSEHSRGGSKYHIIIVGERGSGKSHWCYYLEGVASKLNINSIYISARNNLEPHNLGLIEYLNSKGVNIEEVKKPTIIIVDEVDELLLEETSVSRLRDKFKSDLRRIIDLADTKPIMLVLATLPVPNLDRVFDSPTYAKLFRGIRIGRPREVFSTFGRAAILGLDLFWTDVEINDRAEFLIDVVYEYVKYLLREDPLRSRVSVDLVKGLLDEDLWRFLASMPTLGSALNILKIHIFPLLDKLKKPLTINDVKFTTLTLMKEIHCHKQTYDKLPIRSKIERIARNITIALSKIYNVEYAFDQRIPPARSGWIKVNSLITLKDGRRIALIVPQLDKALYIANRKRLMERTIKLIEGKFIDEVWILVPSSMESKARGLISDRRLAEMIRADKVKIVSINDQELNVLLSDLEAIEWYSDEHVKKMVQKELHSLKDVWGKRVLIS